MRVRMVSTAVEPSVAVWREGGWMPLVAVPGAQRLGLAATDLLAFLAADERVRTLAEELVSVAPVAESSPSPGLPFRPAAFRDCSLWEAHLVAANGGVLRLQESVAGLVSDGYERLTRRSFPRLRPRSLWYEQPLYYKGNPATFLGDGQTVRWPAYAQALDYELEIGVVIAQDSTDLPLDEALGVIGGFVLVNDFSARDVQFREMVEGLMGPAKSKDFGTALGPIVITSQEFLPILDAQDVEVRVNGEVWGTGSTRGMQHSVADVLAYASAGERLAAGTVIGLGTVPGCSGVEVGRWLSPGDVVELSAGPLGTLRTQVGEPEPWRRPDPMTRARWSIVVRAGDEADPKDIDPLPWTPPPAPALEGVLASNRLLDDVERWEVPGGSKPEDVVLDTPAGSTPGLKTAGSGAGRPGSQTRGRPSCAPTHTAARLAWRSTRTTAASSSATLVVGCSVSTTPVMSGCLQTPTAADGSGSPATPPSRQSGTVYFSDSSTRFRIEHYKRDLFEHRPNGRIFCYRPPSGQLDLVADGLYFPNGVALAPDESFLLVAQTGCYDVLRVPLTGAAAGHLEPFVSNLPGFPDNMSVAAGGTYWVALPSPRLAQVDRLMPRRTLRRVAARLPDRLQPAAQHYELVVRLDAAGQIVQTLHGPSGSYREIVGVRQHGDWLYLGSLHETAVGRVRVPA